MLTSQQHKTFTGCARQITAALWKNYWELSKTADKLGAYNTLLEPPATIREANAARVRQLNEKTHVLRKLRDKADKAEEYIAARPQICTITYWDGREGQYVFAGMLPNFDSAPEDEAAALKAVDEYHAREAKTA